MNILFLGSPQAVIAPLKHLMDQESQLGLKIVGIVTPLAKPSGRKLTLKDPPLATFAKEQGLNLLQTKNVNDTEFLRAITDLNVDIIITAAFGQILSDQFLITPKRAVINIHPSLLPLYRGATPVQSSLLDKQTVTGVTILFTVRDLDAGAIIAQKQAEIYPNEKSTELTDRLFAASADLLIESLLKLKDPDFKGSEQDPKGVTHCKKIRKTDGQIQWTQTSENIFAAFRAYDGWPGIFTFFQSKRINLVEIELCNKPEHQDLFASINGLHKPGHFFFDRNSKVLLVLTSTGLICIKKLQSEGGKTIDGSAFWNGFKDKTKSYVFT